jgi:hypothetical protein
MKQLPDRRNLRRQYLLRKRMPFIYIAGNLVCILL